MRDFYEKLKEKNPIVEVAEELIGVKANWLGSSATFEQCPSCGSHDGFRINPETNLYKCFSKKEEGKSFSGDVIDLVMFLKKCDFAQAVEFLAERAGMAVPTITPEENEKREKLKNRRAILKATAEFYITKLTPEVLEYLKCRGFTEETIRQQKIGFSPGSNDLFTHLLRNEFSREDIALAGVVASDNSDYFTPRGETEGYILFPSLAGDMVMDIQGRAFPEGEPKYKNLPGGITCPYNMGASFAEEVYIAEGIPDAITLIQWGYDAIGIYGVNGFKDDWIRNFRKAKRIFVVLDADDAGNKNALKIARLFGSKARVVKIEGAKDVNELLQKHEGQAKDIFEQLLKQAKTAFDMMLDMIPEDPDERVEPINEFLLTLEGMSSIQTERYFDLLSKKTRIKVPALRKQLKELIQDAKKDEGNGSGEIPGEPDILEDPEFIQLGMDIANDILIISQNFHLKYTTKDGIFETWEPMIITSDKRIIPIPKGQGNIANELVTLDLGEGETLAIRNTVTEAENRWSKFGLNSVRDYLDDKVPPVNMAELYREIDGCKRKYFYTDLETDYLICNLYTIMTYFHKLFMSIPFLHLNGLPSSGKSTLARVFDILSFNGMLLIEPSDASLFRMAETYQMTAIIDEKENIGSRSSAQNNPLLMAFLKSRYQQNARVTRMDPDKHGITNSFETFGPTIIGNVHGLEDILAQRAIPIQTRAVPKDKQAQIIGKQPVVDEEFLQIRNKLYCAAMQYFQNVKEMAQNDTRETTGGGRDNEMFHPLLTLATFIDSFEEGLNIEKDLIEAMKAKTELRNMVRDRSPEEMLRAALLELLTKHKQNKPGGSHAFHALEIIDAYNELAGVSQDFVKPQWVGDRLRAMGIIRGNEDCKREIAQVLERNPKTMQPLTEAPVNKKMTHYLVKLDRVAR